MDLLPALRRYAAHEWLVLQKACCRYTNNREKLLRLRYKEKFGHEPDLEHPQTLNEKVMWLMLHEEDPRWSQLADKYRVREYVRACGLGGMLNELYAVWNSAGEIDLDDPRLPDSFVLKPNNGYGDIVLVRDRKRIDRPAVLRRMADAMRHRFGRKSGEWHYLAIKPCIIAERLLPADPAFGSTLVDYKFYCSTENPATARSATNARPRATRRRSSTTPARGRTSDATCGRGSSHKGRSAFRVPSRSTGCSPRPNASRPDSAWCASTSTRSRGAPSSGR